MKRIIIELTDDEWKEILDTVRHEFAEPLSENEIESIVKREATKIIHDIYIRALQQTASPFLLCNSPANGVVNRKKLY